MCQPHNLALSTMERARYIQALQETFSRLKLYHRDTLWQEDMAAAYEPGQILQEADITHMSWKNDGMAAGLRLLIATSFAEDQTYFNAHASRFGHALLPRGSYFKVLDQYRLHQYMQVLLLHIPAPHLELFRWTISTLEEDLIKICRHHFEERLTIHPAPALLTEEWVHKTSHPTGLPATNI